ncbi:MAG: bifunctional diaminohydroxyphosphoribosylaminopyrimidine deaminase/5-amino-6-(5-phosphoribosylamino)uracil reductase RibD [Nitrospiria bacterium]
MDSDERIMKKVLQLARKGMGSVSPNPMVGAIITRNGKIVGRGYHQMAGLPHAEVNAIEQAGSKTQGGTLYLNLEPCCHSDKRTPPCTEAIIKSGIKKVIFSIRDPNPKVNGKGLFILRKSGIKVQEGVLKEEAEVLNEIFLRFIKTDFPFIALKVAATLDGKIANRLGLSKWITGEKSRQFAHRLRNQYDAILVGKGTVLADDPELTTRLPSRKQRNPIRIIVDEDLALPLKSRVFVLRPGDRVLIATSKTSDKGKKLLLEQKGIKVLKISKENNGISLVSLFRTLGKMGISSVLIEGGSRINASAVQGNLVDKVYYILALKIMGGTDSISAIGGDSPSSLSNLPNLKKEKIRKLGNDLLIEAYLK